MEGLLVLVIVVLGIYGLIKMVTVKGQEKTSTRSTPPKGGQQREPVSASSMIITISGPDSKRSRRKWVDPDRVWVPVNHTVEIAGYTIHGGMIYLGEYLQSAGGYADPEPALINPRLKVERVRPNSSGEGMPYWPSYSNIEPSSRAAYLDWLASGRSDPNAYIGYVFLYFYGLERRALADAETSAKALGEITAIRSEVERLFALYQRHKSFRWYSGEFLNRLRLQQPSVRVYEEEPPLSRTGYEPPIPLRVALGQLAAEGKPVPADWAFAWLLLHPNARLRTPARRCPEEFRALFKLRYSERYGEGLQVPPNKTRIVWEYQPASASFPRSLKVPLGNLPDVCVLTGPLNKLIEIGDKCADELEPFSRFMAHPHTDRQDVTAMALLPHALVKEKKNPAVMELQKWIEERLGEKDIGEFPTEDLISHWPREKGDRLTSKETTLLAQLLEKIGYGLEPDPRFGGPTLKTGGTAMVFRTPTQAPKTLSPQYVASAALLHLGALISHSDGKISDSERSFLLSHIESAMQLTDGESRRLHAHLAWLVSSIPAVAGLRKRIEALSKEQKQALAGFCIGVAGADGRVDSGEIKTLTKLYPMLGFSADDVYSHLHALMSRTSIPPAEGPVTVQEAKRIRTGFAVPPPEEMKRTIARGVTLDMKAVHAKLEETAEVSALLSTVFVEETTRMLPPAGVEKQNRVGPLDEAHSLLLRALVDKGKLSRGEFEQLAASLGLLPDGALDTINDAAFEVCDGLICDGDDPISVDAELAKEMLS
jgi:tellurite resistance protein